MYIYIHGNKHIPNHQTRVFLNLRPSGWSHQVHLQKLAAVLLQRFAQEASHFLRVVVVGPAAQVGNDQDSWTSQDVTSSCQHGVLSGESMVSGGNHMETAKRSLLVGGFNPSEQYLAVGMIIPNIWEKKCSKPPTSLSIFTNIPSGLPSYASNKISDR